MARNVNDAAMLLDIMAGYDSRDPMSLDNPTVSFEKTAAEQRVPPRIAFSPDLGVTPVDPEVAEICERAALRFEELGANVEKAHPDFSGLQDVFQVHRAVSYGTSLGPELEANRDTFKPEIVWNVEKGLALTGQDIMNAMVARSKIYQRADAFFSDFDLILTPATVLHRTRGSGDVDSLWIYPKRIAGRFTDRGPCPRRSKIAFRGKRP